MQLKKEIENVHQYKWGYNLIKTPVDFCLRMFYKKIEFDSLDQKYFNQPCIYIINHQNTFIDALMLVYQNYRRQITFIARADVFKKPLARKILLYLKILPIFRERDGVDLTKENQVIIDQCSLILNDNKSFGIFPEGTHHGKYFIRPFKKGTARIAFHAAEKMQFSRPIYIIPTSIYYADIVNGYSTIYVSHGEIINLTQYYSLYKENPAKAITLLTKDMLNNMVQVNLHVSLNEKYYDVVHTFSSVYYSLHAKNINSVKEEFFFKKESIHTIEKNIQILAEDVIFEAENIAKKFTNWLKFNNIKEAVFNKSVRNLEKSWRLYSEYFFFFPLMIILKILIQPIQNIIQKKVNDMTKRDELFSAALKFGFGMLIFGLYSTSLSILSYFLFGKAFGIFFFFVFPFLYKTHNYLKELKDSIRVIHLLHKSDEWNKIQYFLKHNILKQ
jgi:1-acyl-sn-glycerol-3-phosphate acyltransferase